MLCVGLWNGVGFVIFYVGECGMVLDDSFVQELKENNIPIDKVRICYSPFSRTTQTAKIVASVLNIALEGPQGKVGKIYIYIVVVQCYRLILILNFEEIEQRMILVNGKGIGDALCYRKQRFLVLTVNWPLCFISSVKNTPCLVSI